jgi:hypothetical protein
MSNNILITFGCSWTFGEGSGYVDGMSEVEYKKIQHDPKICYENSWRKVLVDHYNLVHINFSVSGSSNQRQFKTAREYFVTEKWKKLINNPKNNVVVLWGITSTYRNYFWCKDTRRYENIFYNLKGDKIEYNNYQDKLAEAMLKWSYNREVEVEVIKNEILFFNHYFNLVGVKNLWFDTFNFINYGEKFNNFLDESLEQRDLLSMLCYEHARKSNIKLILDNNFKYAEESGLINSFSYHPKKDQYKIIGEYFIRKLKKYFK